MNFAVFDSNFFIFISLYFILCIDPEMRSLAEADMEACGKDIEQLESEVMTTLNLPSVSS